MSSAKRNIVIVTTGRADWGILSPLARALSVEPSINLFIAAGNMHLLDRYGHTIDEIVAEGYDNIIPLGRVDTDSTLKSRSELIAGMTTGIATVIERTRADAVIILGDRFEMLGAASAALIAGVPIVHLHGGEISEGAIDDSVRHALSKMATLHLVSTQKSADRLMRMGEEPERIVRTGAIGVENITRLQPMPPDELSRCLDGFVVDPDKTFLITFHPVTRHPGGVPVQRQIENLLGALADVVGWNAIITYPNNDADSDPLIRSLEEFASANNDRVKLVKSLGNYKFLSVMHYARAVVGNSSSGILEAPSTPADTLDIGPRQQGRERSSLVIHVDDNRTEIAEALRKLLSQPRKTRNLKDNPYYAPQSVATATRAIVDILPKLSLNKKFYTAGK